MSDLRELLAKARAMVDVAFDDGDSGREEMSPELVAWLAEIDAALAGARATEGESCPHEAFHFDVLRVDGRVRRRRCCARYVCCFGGQGNWTIEPLAAERAAGVK